LQLGTFSQELEDAFDQSMNSSAQTKRLDLAAMKKLLISLTKEHKTMLLIDALDECEKREDLLSLLASLRHETLQMNLLITSRNENDIHEALSEFPRLCIENFSSEVVEDIGLYINSRLDNDKKLQWLNPIIKSDIQRSLKTKANNM